MIEIAVHPLVLVFASAIALVLSRVLGSDRLRQFFAWACLFFLLAAVMETSLLQSSKIKTIASSATDLSNVTTTNTTYLFEHEDTFWILDFVAAFVLIFAVILTGAELVRDMLMLLYSTMKKWR